MVKKYYEGHYYTTGAQVNNLEVAETINELTIVELEKITKYSIDSNWGSFIKKELLNMKKQPQYRITVMSDSVYVFDLGKIYEAKHLFDKFLEKTKEKKNE